MTHAVRAAGAALAAATMIVASAGTASAALTSPAPDSIIRGGDVTIAEDTGGAYATGSGLCAYSANHADSHITVTREADGELVFDKSKGSAGAWQTAWNTDDLAAGLYRLKSTSINAKLALVSGKYACVTTSSVVSDYTVEIRPWQHRMTDVTKRATVYFNTEGDHEYAVRLDGATSRVVAVPDMTILQNRFVAINNDSGDVGLTGSFDLETGAFSAKVHLGSRTAVVASTGSSDAKVDSVKGQLQALAAQAGLDFDKVLATKLSLRADNQKGGTDGAELSLGDGLTIVQNSSDKPGVAVKPTALSGGIVLHIYINQAPGSALAYHVTDTGLPTPPAVEIPALPVSPPALPDLPELPSVPGAPALPKVGVPAVPQKVGGGPVWQVKGKYATGTHAVGTTALATLDTTPGSPEGLLWVPGLNAGMVKDSQIDFVGQGTVTQQEVCILGVCTAFGVIIGDGAAQYNGSPVPLPDISSVTGKLPKQG